MKRTYIIFHKDGRGKVERLKSFTLHGDTEHALMCWLGLILADVKAQPPTIVMSGGQKMAQLIGPNEWEIYP